MMSVLEYAIDVNKSVNEILKECRELGINVSGEEDMLSEDDIIELDSFVDNIVDDDVVEDLVNDVKIDADELDNSIPVQKLKKKTVQNSQKINKKELANKKYSKWDEFLNTYINIPITD